MADELQAWIQYAIKLEIAGHDLYEECLKVVKHPRAKQLFDFLVTAEEKHKEYLESFLKGLKSGDRSEIEKGMKKFDSIPDEQKIFTAEKFKDVLDGSAPVTEMFNKAIKGEVMSIELYLKLSDDQEDGDLKDFFIRMANEELGHKKSLEGMGLEVFGMNFGDDDEVETIEDFRPRPMKEIEVVAEGVKFAPESIVVDEGDKVILKFVSKGGAHGIVCPTFAIKEYLPEGELVIAEVFPDQPGEFEFFNNVPAGSGWKEMRGKIVVNETAAGKEKRDKKKDDNDPLG